MEPRALSLAPAAPPPATSLPQAGEPALRLLLGVLLLGVLALAGGCGGEPDEGGDDGTRMNYDARGNRLDGTRAPPTRPPNLLVIVLDTLRADALDAVAAQRGGPGAEAMPFLDRLASQGVVLRDATAPAPWTHPSMASLFTGMLPHKHGIIDSRLRQGIPLAITTYAEALRQGHGYETAAFLYGPWFELDDGLLQGFGDGVKSFHLQGGEDFLAAWLRRLDAERPFFLLLHSYEVHDPYGPQGHPYPERPSPPVDPQLVIEADEPWELTRAFFLDRPLRMAIASRRGRELARTVTRYTGGGFVDDPRPELMADLTRGYWDGVRWVDGLLERTLGFLEAEGVLDDTLLVITSDHGEALGEHALIGHGRRLYDELVRIPMVMVGPEPFTGGRVIEGGFALHDVLPTYFELAGLAPLEDRDGRSQLALIEGTSSGRPVLSEEVLHDGNTARDQEAIMLSVRDPRWKYLVTYDITAGTLREELYDLAADPLELEDLAGADGRVAGDVAFDEAFCAAVTRVRERIWAIATGDQARFGTPYGASIQRLDAEPFVPCRPAGARGEGGTD